MLAEGKIPKIREIAHGLSFVISILLLLGYLPYALVSFGSVIQYNLREQSVPDIMTLRTVASEILLKTTIVSCLAILVYGLMTQVFYFLLLAGNWQIKKIEFKLFNWSLLPKFKEGLITLSGGIVKVLLIVPVAWAALIIYQNKTLLAYKMPFQQILEIPFSVTFKVSGVLGLLFAISYITLWWRWRRSVMQAESDFRRDLKEQEGDPHYKAYRRETQIALSYEELVRRVRRSKVIIVSRS